MANPHGENTGVGVQARLEKWSWAAAILLAGFFFASSIYIASRRLLWFDEIVTVLLARLPHVTTIWEALLHRADLLPIPYYLIVRASESLFGPSEMAARLPSAAAMAAGLLLTFDATRRLTNGIFGLIAEAVLTCSFLPYYGHEARPYALCFMLSALLLWVWLRTRDSVPVAAVCGAVVLAGTTVHYYMILTLVPFAGYELLHGRIWCKRVIGGAIGAIVALGLLAPQIVVGHHTGVAGNWWAQPSLRRLIITYKTFFPFAVPLLAVIALWVAIVANGKKDPAAPMSDGERLGWLFILLPIGGYALAEVATHSFVNRYFIGVLPGVALAFSCLLYRHFGQTFRIWSVILAVFAIFGAVQQAWATRHPDLINSKQQENQGYPSGNPAERLDEQVETKAMLGLEDALQEDGKRFIATSGDGSLLFWLRTWYYSQHQHRYVRVGEGIPTTGLIEYAPLTFWTMADLKQHASETAIVEPGPGFLQKLKDAGLRPVIHSGTPLEVIYLE